MVYWEAMNQALLRDLFWGEQAYRTYWYAFLLSFPFSWRNVLLPSVAGGAFNEFLDLSIYIGDILILSSILLLLKHKDINKSILDWIEKFHVEHVALFFLLCYIAVSLFFADSRLLVVDSTFSVLRILAIAIIFFYTLNEVDSNGQRSTWNNVRLTILILILGVLFQSIIALGQFSTNSSVGLKLVGEPILSTMMPGVAEVDILGEKQLRAYGTFLHPNVLGGFLVIMLLIIYAYFRLFHVEQNKDRIKRFHVEHYLLLLTTFCALFALAFTFSKSAIFVLMVSIVIVLFHVERRGQCIRKFHVEHIVFIFYLITSITILVIQGNNGNLIKSIYERLDIYQVTTQASQNNEFMGLGLGNSTLALHNLESLEAWQLQPIHNIYLILLTELGYIGGGILIVCLVALLKHVPRGTNILYYLPLMGVIIIGLFDHYPLTLFVGNVLFGLALGWLLYGISIDKIKE